MFILCSVLILHIGYIDAGHCHQVPLGSFRLLMARPMYGCDPAAYTGKYYPTLHIFYYTLHIT